MQALSEKSVPTPDPAAGLHPVSLEWLATNLPCRDACPVGTHAGGYVSFIAQGLYKEAYFLARRPNPFASICGLVCAHPCEAACRRQYLDKPVSIRALKRFVTERFGVESEHTFEEIEQVIDRPRPKAEQPGRVAIIGAGPAGLACAHDLAIMGHKVVVFDAASVAGGMMRMGIPEYRLPRELIQCEVDFIEHLGVEIRLGVEIGKDVLFSSLRKDYDSIFLAPGCRRGRGLNLPGMEADGVLTAIDFLVEVNLGIPVTIGEEVVVVGGGNVAFDVARSARRFGGTSVPDELHHNLMLDTARTAARTLGKKVTMVTLESEEELPADPEEVVEGREEGVTIIHRRMPRAVLDAEGKVRALQTVDVSRVFDDEGRFDPQTIEGTERELKCDTLIFAVGQLSDLSFLGEEHGFELTPRGTLVVDKQSLSTSVEGVYAGGDAAFGPRIIIEAVAEGKRAALSMDTYLTGRRTAPAVYSMRRFDTFGYAHPFAYGDYETLERAEVPMLELGARTGQAQVESGYSEAEARQEGARCLHCWINTIFDSRPASGSECVQCGGCSDVCPVDCISLVHGSRLSGADGGQVIHGQVLNLSGTGAVLFKDETRCIRCGLCARRCPVGCITMQGFYKQDEGALFKLCERVL
ncbi:MAG: 4Fe-4S ferredoxin [Deltaproteobacteria bacterium CG_4_9_14_3_um_filter_63_12]|nr:MAG: 4Fe-4S ferredoxin [Deltaproteobacteria bacterium CG_4_9_14_3_um_filter_63_12]